MKPYDLASFDSENSAWITEKGDYKIQAGSSIANLPLMGRVNKNKTEVVRKTNKVLAPSQKIATFQ